MNERIIELMNQANKDAGFTFSMDQAKPVHDLMEKFAELIVRECSHLIETMDARTEPADHIYLLKCFGITK